MKAITIPKLPIRYHKGRLFWTERCGQNVRAGDEAGTLNAKGYVQIKFEGSLYYAHRIIWTIHNGPIPDGYTVDHINHHRADNHIENLRLAENMTKQNGNRLAKGFYYHKPSGKFQAKISVGGRQKSLGLYETELDARAAYIRAHREIHGEFSPYNNWEMQKRPWIQETIPEDER